MKMGWCTLKLCFITAGMSKEDAMTAYVALAKEIIAKYGMWWKIWFIVKCRIKKCNRKENLNIYRRLFFFYF